MFLIAAREKIIGRSGILSRQHRDRHHRYSTLIPAIFTMRSGYKAKAVSFPSAETSAKAARTDKTAAGL
jgi:hypothetical protein